MLTIDQIAHFDRDGFVFVEGMFSIAEVDILRKAVKSASRVRKQTIVAHDADDNESPLSIWSDSETTCSASCRQALALSTP